MDGRQQGFKAKATHLGPRLKVSMARMDSKPGLKAYELTANPILTQTLTKVPQRWIPRMITGPGAGSRSPWPVSQTSRAFPRSWVQKPDVGSYMMIYTSPPGIPELNLLRKSHQKDWEISWFSLDPSVPQVF